LKISNCKNFLFKLGTNEKEVRGHWNRR
jgi:hypothetical protein